MIFEVSNLSSNHNIAISYTLIDENIFRDTGELVVGIIDYIRTFTWDKKLEM